MVSTSARAIAGVDGGIGLDKFSKVLMPKLVRPSALTMRWLRFGHTERVANGQYLIAHLNGVGVAKMNGW